MTTKSKEYLNDGDEAFCDGVMLYWDQDEQRFELGEIHYDGAIYYNGEEINVEYDKNGRGYITKN